MRVMRDSKYDDSLALDTGSCVTTIWNKMIVKYIRKSLNAMRLMTNAGSRICDMIATLGFERNVWQIF